MNALTLPPELPEETDTVDHEAEVYLPVEEIAQPDDAESTTRFPARVVRDATALQERRWGAHVPQPETGLGED